MSLKDLGSADADLSSLTAILVGLGDAERCAVVGVRSGNLVSGGGLDCGRSADIIDGGGGGGISGRVGLVRS
jgi:hypothetical protein